LLKKYKSKASNGEAKPFKSKPFKMKLQLLHVHNPNEIQPLSRDFVTLAAMKIRTKESSVKDPEKNGV